MTDRTRWPPAPVELVGVRFDGMGRAGAQARAPSALRAAGLATSFLDVHAPPDIVVSPPVAARAHSGFLNGRALVEMICSLRSRLSAAFAEGRFPVVYGADCAVLLACVPALSETFHHAGLVSVDAHEDATPMSRSRSGEAANMEIGLLTGLSDEPRARTLPVALPALAPAAVSLLGPRDAVYREPLKVSTIADRVHVRTAVEVSLDPLGAGREAARHVLAQTPTWWLHVDFDVLSKAEFRACGAPGEVSLEGGLTWSELTAVVSSALRVGGCVGLSLAVYNPDLDPDLADAARVVEFVRALAQPRPDLAQREPGPIGHRRSRVQPSGVK